MIIPRKHFRFTVRRLMIAVAIASLVLGAVAEWVRLARLRSAYQALAARHAREMRRTVLADKSIFLAREKVEREGMVDPMAYLGVGPRIVAPYSLICSLNDQRNQYYFRSQWHERMKANYERAADRPWLSVEPDTPDPR